MKVTAKMLTQILLDLGYVFTPPDPEPHVQDNDSLIDLLNYSFINRKDSIYVNDTREWYTHEFKNPELKTTFLLKYI